MKKTVIMALAMSSSALYANDSLTAVYMAKLDSVKAVASQQVSGYYNPYCIQLFAPGTVYQNTLRQIFSTGECDTKDKELILLQNINNTLMTTYTQKPWLICQTEAQIQAEESLIHPVVEQKPHEEKLVNKIVETPELSPEVDEVAIVIKKPNFWKFTGDCSLQFTQNYFSKHWYQGGDNFYSMLSLANIKLKYDNKQGLQWENLLEMKLGFQTNESDEKHSLKSFNDQLRFTSKVGFKAAKNWNYAAQLQAWTQFLPSYQANSDKYNSCFAAPLDAVASLGMDWKVNLKRFEASLYIAPIAYSMRYVRERDVTKTDAGLTSHHGVDIGHHVKHNYGPNITFRYTWKICQDVKWESRLYVLTDLHRVLGEYENTFTFTINKFLNSKVYLYPRYDDSDTKYKNENGRYTMFKEWLSLGLNYTW